MVKKSEIEFRVRDLKLDIDKNPNIYSNDKKIRSDLFKLIDKNILEINW